MGYRSFVAITLEPSALEYVVKKFELRPLKDNPFADADLVVVKDGHILFEWENVKWYSSYPDIIEIEHTLDEIEEKELGEYGFVRAGEDYDDGEERGDLINEAPFYLHIVFSSPQVEYSP